MLVPAEPGQRWSLDFVSDNLSDRRRFRIRAVIDDCSRECLALLMDTFISGIRVARRMGQLVESHGRTRIIVSDNGTDFTSNAFLK